MNFCTKCGTKNRENAKFCSRCGNIMDKRSPSPSHIDSYYDKDEDDYNYDKRDYEYDDRYFGPPRLIDEDEFKRARARKIIHTFAIMAAALVAIKIPFCDIFFLLPLQCAMIVSIGKIYDKEIKPEKTFMEIAAAAGFSIMGEISALIIGNFIPVIGGLLTAPFVYGWTCGMGEVSIKYFESNGLFDEDMEYIYRQTSSQAYNNYRGSDMSKEESLEKLKNHLTPEEYEQIKKKFKA
ncbi:MAG: zinc-ribbon domain-containing protein [Candidatus Eremiobacterota bacterium]